MSREIRQRLLNMVRELEDILDKMDEEFEEETSVETSQPSVSEKKLAVVVGHTRQRPGARAESPIGEQEYFWNSDLAKMMEEQAQSQQMPLKVFYRDGIGVAGAYQQAQEWGASAVIELHFNSFSTPSATGTETLWVTQPSEGLGNAVQQAMIGVLGLRDRGAKRPFQGRGEASLTALPDTPSVLIEPFFGSNPNDCQRAEERKTDLARAIVNAANSVLNA
jgi:N-acetylmuramoyl-L-alanine amidase